MPHLKIESLGIKTAPLEKLMSSLVTGLEAFCPAKRFVLDRNAFAFCLLLSMGIKKRQTKPYQPFSLESRGRKRIP